MLQAEKKPNIKNTHANKAHIALRIVGVMMIVIGLILFLGGGYLIVLGGSWYYGLLGIALLVSGLFVRRGEIKGVWIGLSAFVLSVIWAIWEVGFSFWPLVPRTIMLLVIAALLLLLIPLIKKEDGKPEHTKPYFYSGLALFVAFGIYLALMFRPHDIISNDFTVVPGKTSTPTAESGDDWLAYGKTGEGARYAPFDQINKDNIDQLEIAWTARTGFIADQSKLLQDQTTPLYVDGTLYHCAPAGQVTALDGVSGEIKWQFDPKATSEDWTRCRSLGYFDPEPGDSCGPRIVQTTVDARLISLRTGDGEPCETFGKEGVVDLALGLGQVDISHLVNSSGPVVAGDKIILGGRVTDNVTTGEPSGVIRAYDAHTGDLAWAWDLGNPGRKGLPPEGESYTPGTPNAWTFLSYDLELGMVYVPLGNATPDIWGGGRRDFDDEYSSSVVALDLNTGGEVWKFQTVHHDLWDYDVPSQPVLADIPDGKGGTIPGLIQTTKRSQVFVLDRRTGKPIKAVEERPVPKADGTVKGDHYAETQPYSTEMAAVGADKLQEKMMWGATPIDQMMCRILFHTSRYEGEFMPPSTHFSIVYPGPLGGVNYGSTAIDQERNIMVAADIRFPLLQHLIPRDEITADMKYTGENGPYAPMEGTPYAMGRKQFVSPLGIPCLQPPWGTVFAIDLASGKQIWQHPAGTAKDLSLGSFQPGIAFYTGLPPLGGPITTRGGLVFYAGTQDYYMRAFDIETGDKLWEERLPTGSQATPMSYMGKDGRQYVVISAGGARGNANDWGDYIVAFALPAK